MATSQSDESHSILLQNLHDNPMVRFHILDDQQQQQQLLQQSVIEIHADASKARRPVSTDGVEAGEFFSWLWSGSRHSGALCISLAAASYILMSVLVRFSRARTLPTFEVVLIRCALVAVISCSTLKWLRTPLLGISSLKTSCLARAVVGFIAMSGFLYSFQVLPAPDALFLSLTSPMLASLVARVILKERCEPKEVAGMMSSMLGLSLVFQPTTLYRGFSDYYVATVVAFSAALLGGISQCMARHIVKTGESPLVLVFTFSLYCCPAAAFCMLVFENFVLPTFFEVIGMVSVGVFGFLGQVLLARGLQLEKVSKTTLVEYIQAIGVFISAALFRDQTPSILNLFGACLATLAVGWSVCMERN